MHSQRVLVIENESLLGAGVERLLAVEESLDVFGISPKNGIVLIQEIERFRPDVIVLDMDTELASSAELLTCLSDFPQIRIIALRLDGSLMSVYEKEDIAIAQTSDFVAAILHNGKDPTDGTG